VFTILALYALVRHWILLFAFCRSDRGIMRIITGTTGDDTFDGGAPRARFFLRPNSAPSDTAL
jgi:hypothetical protein